MLDRLGKELPEIAVGPVAFAQTVHWQPNFGATDKDDKQTGVYKRTRHENHFAATSTQVIFRWPGVVLGSEQQALLEATVPHVSYFGRAESLCALESGKESDLPSDGWCRPCLQDAKPTRRIAEDCRDIFCPDPQDFQAADLWSRRIGRVTLNAGDVPPHFVEDLLSHHPLPDGARWVSYQMPEGWPGRWVVRVAKSVRKKGTTSPALRIARYLRFSLQCRVPISIRFTVPLAEAFRRNAMAQFGRANGGAKSFALSGHEPPEDARGEHQQAFYLPMASRKVRRDSIDELHVWCPYAFTQAEVEALMRVQRLDWGGGKYPVRPVLMTVSDAVPSDSMVCVGQTASRVWRSVTPFVPPRYFYRGNLHGAKLKLNDSPEHQLAQCLRYAGIDTACEIRRLTNGGNAQDFLPPMASWDIVRVPADNDGDHVGMVSAMTHVGSTATPSGRGEKARRVGLFFELTFNSPVSLPMPALGHSCHFGLGLFRAVDARNS